MKSAFGIKLTYDAVRRRYSGERLTGESISFWQERQGWCGCLVTSAHHVSETMGASSPAACYRSMRGQVANLRNALTKALEGHRG